MQIELTSRGLLWTFFRQHRKISLVFAFCTLIGFVYAFTATRYYESAGSLLVRFGRSAQPEIARQLQSTSEEFSQNDRRERLQTYLQILKSRDLVRSLIQNIGIKKLYPDLHKELRPNDDPLEKATTKLLTNDLSIRATANSDIIEARFLNADPELASIFLNRLFEQFIARQSDLYNKQQTDFLAEQVRQARERLYASQRALREYKAETGISSIDEEQKRLLEQKMTASNIALTALDKAKERLENLQAEETRLLTTYNANSTSVKKIREGIAKAQAQVQERQKDLKKRNVGDNKESSATIVSAEVSRIDQRIKQLEAARTQFNDLERQVSVDEEDYKTYLARSEAARINDTLNAQGISRIVVLDAPVVPSQPSRPRRMLVVLFALIAGTIFSLGAAIIAETLDDRFSAPNQLGQTLHLPVLGSFFAASTKR